MFFLTIIKVKILFLIRTKLGVDTKYATFGLIVSNSFEILVLFER